MTVLYSLDVKVMWVQDTLPAISIMVPQQCAGISNKDPPPAEESLLEAN